MQDTLPFFSTVLQEIFHLGIVLGLVESCKEAQETWWFCAFTKYLFYFIYFKVWVTECESRREVSGGEKQRSSTHWLTPPNGHAVQTSSGWSQEPATKVLESPSVPSQAHEWGAGAEVEELGFGLVFQYGKQASQMVA